MRDEDSNIPILTDLIEPGIEITLSELGLEDELDQPEWFNDPVAAESNQNLSLEIDLDDYKLDAELDSYRDKADAGPASRTRRLNHRTALEQEIRRILDEHMELAWQEIKLVLDEETAESNPLDHV